MLLTYERYKQGRRTVKLTTLEALATKHELPIDELIKEANNQQITVVKWS